MRLIENSNKGRPEVSRNLPDSCKKAWLTDSFEYEHIRIHTTMHRGTAPNHIRIYIRPINSDSGTFSRHGTFTPSLAKVSANDRPLYTQIGCNASNFNADRHRTLHLRHFLSCLQLLNQDITRITDKFSLASSSNLSDGLTLRWADIFYNHNTLLRFDW